MFFILLSKCFIYLSTQIQPKQKPTLKFRTKTFIYRFDRYKSRSIEQRIYGRKFYQDPDKRTWSEYFYLPLNVSLLICVLTSIGVIQRCLSCMEGILEFIWKVVNVKLKCEQKKNMCLYTTSTCTSQSTDSQISRFLYEGGI